MSVVAFTAGSLGDILATAGIVIQICQTLLQSSSSCKQYRDVIDELKALHRVLLLANEAMSRHHSDLPLSRSLVDSLKTEVCDCHLMMQSFLDNIRRYRKPLSTTGVKSLWGQVWWAIWEQDELEGLRKSIVTRVQRIHLLLASFNAVSITNVSQEVRNGNLTVNKLVARFSTYTPSLHGLHDMTWVVDIETLTRRIEMSTSLEIFVIPDPNVDYPDHHDASNWHQMGRTYMVVLDFNMAYQSYQQAVYRESRDPHIWRDVGQLYVKINQWQDGLDAYARGIRINPYISETWICLGQLYYASHELGYLGHLQDSLDSYSRALELDPTNHATRAKVAQLRIKVRALCPPSENPNVPGIEEGGIDDEIDYDLSSLFAWQEEGSETSGDIEGKGIRMR